MIKAILLGLSLFINCIAFAQTEIDSIIIDKDSIIIDTFDFDVKNFTPKGELTFISQKSKSTGGVYQISLQIGEWQYFDKNDQLRIQGNFKVKGTESIKIGRWAYFDEQGELLFAEYFPPSKAGVEYFKPFALKTKEGFDIINYNESDVLVKSSFKPPRPVTFNSGTYYINYNNDSLITFNYDTILAMDARNSDKWLIDFPISKPIDEDKNLIENGSFEKQDGKLKDGGANIEKHIHGWMASAGTPDYYRSKHFNALDGIAAIGVRFYTDSWNHIEFLSTTLKEPLEANKTYCLKVFVRLKEDCFYGVNALGALFENKIPKDYKLISGEVLPSMMHHRGSVLTYKTRWMQLACTYVAKGNEEYLTLGSFANSDSMIRRHLKGNVVEAYYFFDNIQLFSIEKPEECPCSMGKKEQVTPSVKDIVEIVEPKTFIIRNIFFENDKWNLLPESFDALDSLFEVIELNDFKKIEISGHTSNTGSRERNILLSKNRAEAVKKYLVKKGLTPKMFICKGYGPDQPISDNDTEEGQAENRRVEFTILE
jgi:OOP family OmpA-OmpF porin